MSKSLFLFLASLALVCCEASFRIPNFDYEKLNDCLINKGFEYDDKLKKLRLYHDSQRILVFNLTAEEYGYNEEDKAQMKECFNQYGIIFRVATSFLNCRDECNIKNPGQPCNCPND